MSIRIVYRTDRGTLLLEFAKFYLEVERYFERQRLGHNDGVDRLNKAMNRAALLLNKEGTVEKEEGKESA